MTEETIVAEEAGKTRVSIGAKLRQLRKMRDISLQQLAEETGMSYSYLSGLENDKHSISISTLQRLADYFHVKLIHFLDDSVDPPVFLLEESGAQEVTEDGILINLITAESAKNMKVSFITMPPNTPTARQVLKHPKGEEFISVLEGAIIFLMEGKRYTLRQGDSVFFASEREHVIFTEAQSARIIQVSTPPDGRKGLANAEN